MDQLSAPGLPPGLVTNSARRSHRREKAAAHRHYGALDARVQRLEGILANHGIQCTCSCSDDSTADDVEKPTVTELECVSEYYHIPLVEQACQCNLGAPWQAVPVIDVRDDRSSQTDLSFQDSSLYCHVVDDPATMIESGLASLAHNCFTQHQACDLAVKEILLEVPDTPEDPSPIQDLKIPDISLETQSHIEEHILADAALVMRKFEELRYALAEMDFVSEFGLEFALSNLLEIPIDEEEAETTCQSLCNGFEYFMRARTIEQFLPFMASPSHIKHAEAVDAFKDKCFSLSLAPSEGIGSILRVFHQAEELPFFTFLDLYCSGE